MQCASVMITQLLLYTVYLGVRVTTLRMDRWQWNGVLLQWAEESVIGCIVPAVDITAPCPAPGPPQVPSLDHFNITPITIKLKPHVNYREHSLGLNYNCSNYTIIGYNLKTYVNAIVHTYTYSPRVHLTSCTSNIAYDSLRLQFFVWITKSLIENWINLTENRIKCSISILWRLS